MRIEPPLYCGRPDNLIAIHELNVDYSTEDWVWFKEELEGQKLNTSKSVLARRGITL